jgi:hypothetical protein
MQLRELVRYRAELVRTRTKKLLAMERARYARRRGRVIIEKVVIEEEGHKGKQA